jgi:hypothetical protein
MPCRTSAAGPEGGDSIADAGMSPDTIKAISTEMTFEDFAVRLNA